MRALGVGDFGDAAFVDPNVDGVGLGDGLVALAIYESPDGLAVALNGVLTDPELGVALLILDVEAKDDELENPISLHGFLADHHGST